MLEKGDRRAARVELEVRQVAGALLVQDRDDAAEPRERHDGRDRARADRGRVGGPAVRVARLPHVRSNAIVIARDGATVGIGAGQMSRVDSVRLAVEKARVDSLAGAVLASDAFFPFADGPELAIEAGVAAIIQPGGSVRDAEVIAAADAAGVAMVATGRRHFRH